jgi:hydrogenase nickel incorporation protein HypA/HybF
MHELSIAMSIVEMAEEEAAARGDARIHAVHLRLGLLSGVVKEALLSSYEMASATAPLLEGSQLLIEEVPVEAFCPNCRMARQIASIQWMCCPECGVPTGEILKGKELEVVALEIRE